MENHTGGNYGYVHQVCPTCGRCPTCGQYKNPWPYWNPGTPFWSSSGVNSTSTITYNEAGCGPH